MSPASAVEPHALKVQESPSPLRVLLWSPSGSGLHYSGPGMTAYRMYSRAAPGRFDLTLVHGRADQERYPLFREQTFLRSSRLGFVNQLRYTLAGERWMRRNAGRFDIVHGIQGFHATVAPCAVAQACGVPAVIKFAVHRLELAEKPGLHRLLGIARRRRRMVAGMRGVIAISSDIAEDLRSAGIPDERIARIPNGVDDRQFRPVADEAERRRARLELGWPDRPTILFVGAICVRKRPHLVIEAMGALRRRGVEAQVIFVGPAQEPEYLASMQRRAEELRVTELLRWVGFTPEVAPLYRAADCYVLPSSSEGLPNAMLEAMASGLPAVGTRISGIVDLLGDGRAGTIAEADGEALADALAPLMQDESRRLAAGRAARELIERRYGVEVVLDAHERLFRNVLAGGDARDASLFG